MLVKALTTSIAASTESCCYYLSQNLRLKLKNESMHISTSIFNDT